MERCPGVASLHLTQEFCASYGWLKIGYDCPNDLESCPRLPMKGHKYPHASYPFPTGTGNDSKSPLLFPPVGPLSP